MISDFLIFANVIKKILIKKHLSRDVQETIIPLLRPGSLAAGTPSLASGAH